MAYRKGIARAMMLGLSVVLYACHSNNGNPANNAGTLNAQDTASSATRKVSVIISSIPFPSSILDTLRNLQIQYKSNLLNPVTRTVLYAESNSQAANLGIYGADLAYVISFEQFQEVGDYMKATKYLADNIGIPLAFTAQVIERCRKNQNNGDSLNRIVLQSYNTINETLKQGKRDAAEVLVLTGGWVEGVYLTTQSIDSVPQGTHRRRLYRLLTEQKQYAGKLLTLLNDAGVSSPYCKSLVLPMQAVKSAFDDILSEFDLKNQSLSALANKVKDMRSQITKDSAQG